MKHNTSEGLFRNFKQTRIIFFYLAACAILTISLFFFAWNIGKPYMGIMLSTDEQGWAVQSVDPNGQATQSGINVGDRPVEINGQPAQAFLDKYEEAGIVFGRLIKQISVISEDEQLITFSLEESSASSESVIEMISWLIVSLAFWITGFYVFFKRPENHAAALLCLGGLVFGLCLSANGAAERGILEAVWIEVISTTIAPWLLLHFFLVLPEDRPRTHDIPWLYLIYLPAAVILVLFPIFGYADGQPLPLFRTVRMFGIGAGFLAAIIAAVVNYSRAVSPRTRQQMKIVLTGALAALIPFLLLSILPAAIQGQYITPSGFNILFISFIPISMGYAVFTQKLLDIDVFIRRGVIYGVITLIMAAILAVAIFTAIYFFDQLGVTGEIIIALALGGIAVALFGPLQKKTEAVIDKFFYKDRYEYRQIIHSVNLSLTSLREFNEISRFIVGTAVRTLNLAGGCLIVKGQTGAYEVSAAQGTFGDAVKISRIINIITNRRHLIEFPLSASDVDPDIMFFIPLNAGDKEVGILCLSKKATRQKYSADDIYLLQGLASVTAVALHSATLIRDVSLRDTFVSIASHELRTPLTSVMGYAELMLKRKVPEDTRQQWIENIHHNGQIISDIVDDLLNVSRIHSGKVSMKLEAVPLTDILQERLDMVREINNKHEFILETAPGLPDVLVDRDKFGQIVSNLLSNAIKYSPDGGRVTLAAFKNGARDRIIVSVADEGIGISPADRELLFTTFHRIQRPETMGIRGCGLGLYIVKEWIQAMNGEVWLESELNKGSTFYVSIPISNSRSK